MEKPTKQCNSLGILPPKLGSNYSTKPKDLNTSKILSKSGKEREKERQCKHNTTGKQYDAHSVYTTRIYFAIRKI